MSNHLPARSISGRAPAGATGAGFLTPHCGDIMQMPGVGKTPAGCNVDTDDDGRTVGLF